MSEGKNVIKNNSEILFIYEAKLMNPNGDPDDENRPRMDPKTRRNLVTDVRLKRYFRDYVISKQGEESVWVTKLKGKNVSATERLLALGDPEEMRENPEKMLEKCIDARLFGATIPLKVKKGRKRRKSKKEESMSDSDTEDEEKNGESGKGGDSISYTGPVQFTWGYSLHRVDMVDSRTITSLLSGTSEEDNKENDRKSYGNIGKDYRIYYSMIAFHGAVSAKRAEITGATEDDLKKLDEYLWNSLVTETVTRSKLGQRPLLYLRVEYSSPEAMKGDLRRFVSVKENSENVRDFSDLKVDTSALLSLVKSKDVVKFYVKCSEEFVNFCEEVKKTGKVGEVKITDEVKITNEGSQ